MAAKRSAGLLLYRRTHHDDEIVLEVLLGHMGGPFWARKDDAAWSIPKGEYTLNDEDPLAAAKRSSGRSWARHLPRWCTATWAA